MFTACRTCLVRCCISRHFLASGIGFISWSSTHIRETIFMICCVRLVSVHAAALRTASGALSVSCCFFSSEPLGTRRKLLLQFQCVFRLLGGTLYGFNKLSLIVRSRSEWTRLGTQIRPWVTDLNNSQLSSFREVSFVYFPKSISMVTCRPFPAYASLGRG